jgi:hypothetical protein
LFDFFRGIDGILSLAVGAQSAYFCSRYFDLKSQGRLDLIPEVLYGFAEELLDRAALETDHMGVSPLQTRLVVVLLAFVVEKIKLVDQTFLFQHFERAVDGDAIDFRVALLGQFEQLIGVEMSMSVVDDLEQQLALPGEPNPMGL